MEAKNVDLSSLRISREKKNVDPERKGRTLKRLISVVGLVVLLAAAYIGWKSFTKPALEVRLTAAVLQSPAQSNAVLTASGYVVAQRKASVASKGTGRLVYLGVVEGDRVLKDQIIARIDDSDIRALLDQAKANLKLNLADLNDAETNDKRQKKLLAAGLASQMESDAAESRYNRVLASIEVARALVRQTEVSLENTLIRAPFDGTVLTKNADVGEVVAPLGAGVNAKAAVVLLADMTSLEAEIDVSESNIEKIALNQDCEIRLDAYPDQAYPGYVAKIVPTADRSKATVMVKIGFRNYDRRVLPEMSAKVVFLNEKSKSGNLENSRQFLVVPASAIVRRAGSSFVFIVRDEKAIEVPVTTGGDLGPLIEIKSGLVSGTKVVEAPDERLANGVKVKVKQ